MTTTVTDGAKAAVSIHDLLAQRWSPRAYDPDARVTDEELAALLEAARWAPSASNHQPRRFIVRRRGEEGFGRIVAHLVPGNQGWAKDASVLVVGVAELRDAQGDPRRWAHYDLGQAVAHLTVQAQALGLDVRQMGGIDAPGLAREFGVPERFEVVSVVAVGHRGSGATSPERLRRPIGELVNPTSWE